MQKSNTEICPGTWFPLFLIIVVLTITPVMAADTPQALLNQADSLFKAKRFSEAYDTYNQLFTSGYVTPASLLRAAWIQEGRGDVPAALANLYRYYRITLDDDAYRKMVEMAGTAGLEGYELSEFQQLNLKWKKYNGWLAAFLALIFLFISGLFIRQRKQEKSRPRNVLAYVNLLLLGAIFVLLNYTSPAPRVFVQASDGVLLKDASVAADRGPAARQGDLFEYDGEQDVWVRVKRNDDLLYIRRTQVVVM